MINVRSMLVAALALVFSAGLAADIIYKKDGTRIESSEKNDVVNETMRRITYRNRDTKQDEYISVWEFNGYDFQRVRSESTFEDAWNSASRTGRQGRWLSVAEEVDDALAVSPEGRYDTASMELRLLYYKLRGLAESDPDGEFEDTWDDYVSKNLDYADREGNLERNFTRTTMSTGPFSSANLVALHATTIKALQAVGMYWAGQGEYQQAYDDGYLVANDMCSALQRILRDEEYITDMAVPSMRAAAEMFESAAEEDSSNAISHWENAKDAYERMEEQFKTIRSLVKQDGARIEAASCSIAMARLYKGAGDENAMRDNLRDARDVLERQVREFEDSAEDENPPLPGWLTEEKATALAAAYNGLGYAAQVEGEYSQSLVQYARATALFSADEEERADALYGSAQTAIMKAKESEVTGYYIGVAERYYEELSSTLAETKAGLKSEELRLAIAELKEE